MGAPAHLKPLATALVMLPGEAEVGRLGRRKLLRHQGEEGEHNAALRRARPITPTPCQLVNARGRFARPGCDKVGWSVPLHCPSRRRTR